mmetsp:Transcript_15016/g.39702  ORF Transcript_15016/g.39702 Transcript_15016/m.39702 type:complete len:216 (+) Transcript_15016:431-1078(+)
MHTASPAHADAHPVPEADLPPEAPRHRRVRGDGTGDVHQVPRGLRHAHLHRGTGAALPSVPLRAQPRRYRLLPLPEVFDVPVRLHVLRARGLREAQEPLPEAEHLPLPRQEAVARLVPEASQHRRCRALCDSAHRPLAHAGVRRRLLRQPADGRRRRGRRDRRRRDAGAAPAGRAAGLRRPAAGEGLGPHALRDRVVYRLRRGGDVQRSCRRQAA